jgi:hypothetical protein
MPHPISGRSRVTIKEVYMKLEISFRKLPEEPSHGEVRSILWRIISSSDHFTIMKFSYNWRASFETPDSWEEIQKMAAGRTVEEAVIRAVLEEK